MNKVLCTYDDLYLLLMFLQGDDIPTQQKDETVNEEHIQEFQGDDIPTQQSKANDTAKEIDDAIAAGVFRTFSMRRAKYERIAKRANHTSLAQMVQVHMLIRYGMWRLF